MAGPPVRIREDVPGELRKAVYSMYDQCSWIVGLLEDTITIYKIRRKMIGLNPDRAEAGEAYIISRIDENEYHRIPIRITPYLVKLLSQRGIVMQLAPEDVKLKRLQNLLFMLHTTKEILDEFTLVTLSRPAEYTYMMLQLVGGYKGKYSDLVAALNKIPISMKIGLLDKMGRVCSEYRRMKVAEYLKDKVRKVPKDLEDYTVIEYIEEGLWEKYRKLSIYVVGYNPVSKEAIKSLIMLLMELEDQMIKIDLEGILNNYKEQLRLRFM